MNYQNLTRAQLIKELQKLQIGNNSLNESNVKDISEHKQTVDEIHESKENIKILSTPLADVTKQNNPDLNQVRNEVQSAFENYMHAYFTYRDADKTFAMFGEEMTIIGSSSDEIAMDLKLAKALYLRDLLQAPKPVYYNCQSINVQVLTATIGLVKAVISIKTEIGNTPLEVEGLRISAIFRQTGNDWFIIHKHISLPANDYEKGESYPIEELKKRNQWLEEKINEKTQALEATNKKLQFDITERKRAEEMLRKSKDQVSQLLQTTDQGIYGIDLDGCCTFINTSALKILGFQISDCIGKNMHNLIHHSHSNGLLYPQIDCPIFRAKLTGESCHLDSEVLWRKNVTSFPAEYSSFPIFENGKILGAVVTFSDITDRKIAEQEINLKNEELLKLNSEKDKFFSIIAHDLRSPFNGFLGLTHMLVDELDVLTLKEIQKIAMTMRSSATNLFRLLENLLNWSRMEQGLIPFNPEKVLLLPTVNESLTVALGLAKNKGIELSCNIPDELAVQADNYMLQTVIRNLVSNAVKFTHKGGKITIAAKSLPANSVEISVEDTGIGMSKKMIDNLFKLDQNTSRKGTEGEPSTGLGLIISKDFIEKHGGRIWVESEEGNGSTFYFTLPTKALHILRTPCL